MKAKMPYIFVYRGDEHENNDRMRQCVCVCVCACLEFSTAHGTRQTAQPHSVNRWSSGRWAESNKITKLFKIATAGQKQVSKNLAWGKNKYLKILQQVFKILSTNYQGAESTWKSTEKIVGLSAKCPCRYEPLDILISCWRLSGKRGSPRVHVTLEKTRTANWLREHNECGVGSDPLRTH